MIENLLVGNAWFALGIGVLSYAAGYCLAFYEAYLYHTGAKNHFELGGLYELTPGFQHVADVREITSVKFFGTLLFLSLAIWVLHWFLIHESDLAEVFVFVMGGLLLRVAAASMQHLRNIVLFRYGQKVGHLQGRVQYSKRLVHTLSFVDLYSFAVLYFLMFSMSESWFFLGGALICLISGLQRSHWTTAYT
ncbi:MAG: hypothetical protein A2Z21_01445 [Candidatus Fraserbacteria bacterium RBG_16_55_9]|uniref:Uncharacterized protein n=1 Tax=Fraserbacteria sp. (strain RBG_16_55_9) TaxID=1817864 RepID=A0A1F5URF2_FRAXR|nr:MAG: hypothetical protein A2Z21_01445 [Candidatus Fraserbacteria bacterium RBG_16_55_9]